MALCLSRRLLDVMASLPTPPAGTGVIFHGRLAPVKYALNGNKWMAVSGSGVVGAFAGHFFYKKVAMRKNPPNPPRSPDDKPPERHPHAPLEDE